MTDTTGGAQQTAVRTIRLYMAARGIRAGALARTLGMSRSSLYDRFKGRVAIDVDELALFADALGTTPAELLRDVDEVLHGSRWSAVLAGEGAAAA